MIHVRQANPLDARQMADLLNQIIAKGGTTARTTPITADEMRSEMRLYPGQTAWILAEDDNAHVLGFQHIGPHPELPPEAADIATFVRLGQTGLGIGSHLFEATKTFARRLGYEWINATIRADNESGLTYYQSKGFEDYRRLPDTVLADGTTVDRLCKRYDL
ncbi:N-acetyltransferase family protein [Roseovarius sp. B08]|uniref:GNAT family N-acetyltransferase n=1 Tax=Roseovarius sp. B08 TaxID=3449223 RepID=UPI003EDC2CAE